MAHKEQIEVHGILTDVTMFDSSAQEIDDAAAWYKGGDRAAGIGAAPAEESTDYPGCYYRAVDGVQEWLNPPLALGVEYRTTERYNGNVVYQKLVKIGLFGYANSEMQYEVVSDMSGIRIFNIQDSIGVSPSGNYFFTISPYKDNYDGGRKMTVEFFYNTDTSIGTDGSLWAKLSTNYNLTTHNAFALLKYYKTS